MIVALKNVLSTGFLELPDFFNLVIFDRTILNLILAIVLILLSFLLKNVLAKLVVRFFNKTLFRKVQLEEETKLQKRVSWLFPLLVFRLADIVWFKFEPEVHRVIDPIILALTIVWLLAVSEIIIHEFFNHLAKNKSESFNKTIFSFSLQIVRVTLVLLGIIMILHAFNINVAALITGLGIGGLAVSMAAKDIIADLIGGFTIMSEKIFEIGDYIANPDIEGTVENIKFRQSEIRALDEGLIYVPNSLLTENYVINYTKRDKRRVDIYVYLPYSTENEQIERLSKYIENDLASQDKVFTDSQYLAIESIEKDFITFYIRYYLSDISYPVFVAERDRIYKVIWQFLLDNNLDQPHTRIEFKAEKFPIEAKQD